MSDEIRLVSEMLSDTYKNSNGHEIAVIKINGKMFGVSVSVISREQSEYFLIEH